MIGKLMQKAQGFFKSNKTMKGQIAFSNMGGWVMSLGFVVIVGAILGSVLASLQASQTVNTTAYNITSFGLSSLLNTFTQLPLAGTVLGFGVILTIVVVAIGRGMFGGGER